VHNRALVVKPWREYKALGNSLFLWRIGYGIAVTMVILCLAALVFIQVVHYSRGRFDPIGIIGIAAVGLLFLVVSVVAGYISLFTNSFIVPIMYKHEMRILHAWQKFLSILKSHLIYFILYGLLFVLLMITVFIAAFLTGCFTCCIGFIILAVPYISSVFLLPVYVTLRAFSLEFLAQWGPEYSVFPVEALPTDSTPPPPLPPTETNVSGE
jgi:hypothetical protein